MALMYLIAQRRGVDKTFWVLMAFFFGPLAIPFVFLSKNQHKAIGCRKM